jgi:guanine deaminase
MTLHAYRGEILSIAHDPLYDADAIRHEADGLLLVEDGIVVARGPYADLAAIYAGVAVEPLPGLIVPGFVDAHVHYPQMDRIASHGEQLLDWLDRHIFPAEKAFVDRAHADQVASLFLDELLRNGTTSALVFPTVHAHSVDVLFEAALNRDMRIVSGKVLMDLGPDGLRDTVESARGESETLIARWRGRGRLGYAVTPRFALTSSNDQLQAAGTLLAAHPDIVMHTHLAENERECAAVAERFPDAADYLDVYDRFGLVGDRSIFAHGIHLSDRSCARLSESGAGIAVCPTSNLFLGSGFFNFAQAAEHGVRLGLGTDIGAGTSFSILHSAGIAYQAALMRGHRLDPFRALYLATAGSARLLRIEDRVGALEVGQEADFVLLDDQATPLLARRTREAPLAERLFALQILGDDRAIRRTYIMGQCAWERDLVGTGIERQNDRS